VAGYTECFSRWKFLGANTVRVEYVFRHLIVYSRHKPTIFCPTKMEVSRVWNLKKILKCWRITLFFVLKLHTFNDKLATLASKFLKICTFENAIVVNNLMQLIHNSKKMFNLNLLIATKKKSDIWKNDKTINKINIINETKNIYLPLRKYT